jgi:putative transcriptional regulator
MVNVEWDDAKNHANQKRHGVSFEEARELFTSGIDYLELFDADHSDVEDRFIAIGPIKRGLVLVVWTERDEDIMTDIPELTEQQFARAIPARLRRRLMSGRFDSGKDIAALRRFVGLTQAAFARAMGISVHTLRNWEQGRRQPEGPAVALLRIAARHPRIIRENLRSAA